MLKVVSLVCFVLVACGSDDDDSSANGNCPNVSGSWTVSEHCDASLVGKKADVTQTGCNLAFAAPFNGFSGSVTAAGDVSVTGPQTCSGKASSSEIALDCTPSACKVTLAR